MTGPQPNSLAWFEVAVDDVDAAETFYSRLFGWSFALDPVSASQGMDYRVTSTPDGAAPMGGLMKKDPGQPGHAVFYLAVTDVGTVCDRATGLGARMVTRVVDPPAGPAFAHLRDPEGNLFAVFTPPAG